MPLPGSEDEQPLVEPPTEVVPAAQQGGWKLRDRATAQHSQEDSELRFCPVTTRVMLGREIPGFQPAPAEDHIQVVDDLQPAAAPLECRDLLGLQEWWEDGGPEEHGQLVVIPDCVLEPEVAQPLVEEFIPQPISSLSANWR